MQESQNKILQLFSGRFDLFLEIKAEILEKISLVFWKIWRHQNDILKSTDHYSQVSIKRAARLIETWEYILIASLKVHQKWLTKMEEKPIKGSMFSVSSSFWAEYVEFLEES